MRMATALSTNFGHASVFLSAETDCTMELVHLTVMKVFSSWNTDGATGARNSLTLSTVMP